MDIPDEGALDKSLQVTGKNLDEKTLENILWGNWRWIIQTDRC